MPNRMISTAEARDGAPPSAARPRDRRHQRADAREHRDNLTALLENPDGLLNDVADDDIPRLIGALEQMKTLLSMRLIGARLKTDSHGADAVTLVDADKLAELFNMTPAYVYALARKRKIPAVREGKYVRFCLADVRDWISRHRDYPMNSAGVPRSRRNR